MQIIGHFYTRKSYAKAAVDLLIGQNDLKVKYYGSYRRKNFIPVKIFRYYEITS
jgi:hypothetical protein